MLVCKIWLLSLLVLLLPVVLLFVFLLLPQAADPA
jgi:hypothetical protein